jgi:hypothetical protein
MERFNSLELRYKGSLLKKNAVYLMLTNYQHYTVTLYYWDRFFIELYYDDERGQTTRITLASTKDLDKFLNEISITCLGLSSLQ